MLNFIANWRREREAVRELSRLSDRELADLGVARADIKAIAGGATLMTRTEVLEALAPVTALRDFNRTEAKVWPSEDRRSLAA